MSLFDLDGLRRTLSECEPLPVTGTVVRAAGLVIEAMLPQVTIGTYCEIRTRDNQIVQAEVIGFEGATARLMPFGKIEGVGEGAVVYPRSQASRISVGPALLGRVVNPSMQPVDGGPSMILRDQVPIDAQPPAAMSRRRISRPLVLGIRSIDACLTVGEGQRLCVLAGPGVGKSVLLGMLARSASADVIVVGLVGERGREVREFIERDLGPQGLRRSVVVVATSDEPPLMRLRAAMAATSVAEYFRKQGKKVLLLMDSLTRVAQAQREIGLAAGEPPTSKGYPPSVFAMLPQLLERAGNDSGNGSITAFYTALAEGDDLHDPVVDAAKATLDGHVVLSRKIAEGGNFPAIDLLGSISRVMSDVIDAKHLMLARSVREILSTYRESADLVEVGAYVAGSNLKLDRALKVIEAIRQFLRQTPEERFTLEETLSQLRRILDVKETARG